MSFERGKAFLKFFACGLCLATLAGCTMADVQSEFQSRMQFSVNWVSPDGKTKEQLNEDQKQCTHEAMLASAPPFPGELGSSGGDIRVFDNCMRSKGWVKE